MSTYLALSGGNSLVASQVAPVREIIREVGGVQNITAIHGVSGGALVGAMTAQGRVDQLEKLFLSVDGVGWYLTPSLTDDSDPTDVTRGWYAMEPLGTRVFENVRPKRMVTQMYAGVTSLETGGYRARSCHDVGRKKCRNRILKSCSQPIIMQPVDAGPYEVDGGVVRVTAHPDGLQPGDRLYVVVSPPVGAGRKHLWARAPKGLIGAGKRVFQLLMDVVIAHNLLELRNLAAEGVEVHLLAPPPDVDPGDPFDADPAEIRRRLYTVGPAIWQNRIRL